MRGAVHGGKDTFPINDERVVSKKASADLDVNDICSICLDDLNDKDPSQHIITAPCKHRFHEPCIDKWVAKQNNCPLCKQKVTDKQQDHRSIIPLIDGNDSLDERIRNLVNLIIDKPDFYALGGAEGRMYGIQDPHPDEEVKVPPFVLSDVVPGEMNRRKARSFCMKRGSKLPSSKQLEALVRAMTINGFYNQGTIAKMYGDYAVIWSDDDNNGLAYVLDGRGVASIVATAHYFKFSFRCIVDGR